MKKLISALLLIVLNSMVVKSQESAVFKKYKINTTGYCKSLPIGSGFVMTVSAHYTHSLDSANFKMEVVVDTYNDSICSRLICNDSIRNRVDFILPASYLDSKTHRECVGDFITPLLNGFYDPSNVIEIN